MSPRKKIPTKAELIQLQKIYKTDEKIGEYLGGVPAYLVAYWRRKKNVPKHSVPKFSEKEIRGFWERFGDDDKCGLELGISKAAFYNWRRRYGIREKPAFLKLEQLELEFPGLKLKRFIDTLYGKQSMIQKIFARASGQEKVEVGQTVEVEPDFTVVQHDACEIVEKFKKLGVEYVWNPARIALALAPCNTEKTEDSVSSYQVIRDFARRQGIKQFYDSRDGFANQLVLEKGKLLPGFLALDLDLHSAGFGSLSTFSGQISPETMASVWSSGKLTLKVPASIRVEINGRRNRGVYTRDVALSVIKQLYNQSSNGRTVEFAGSVVSHMNVSERYTLTSIALDMSATSAVTPFDAVTRRYLAGRSNLPYQPAVSDKDTVYDGLYVINIDQLVPQIAGPESSSSVRSVLEAEGTRIDQIVLGTCMNGRFDDLRISAEILKGKKVHPDCRLFLLPASRLVFLEALKKGLIRVLVESGAIILNPGFNIFADSNSALLGDGGKILATANGRVFHDKIRRGREIYLCSPATAAASAINGAITDPTRYLK